MPLGRDRLASTADFTVAPWPAGVAPSASGLPLLHCWRGGSNRLSSIASRHCRFGGLWMVAKACPIYEVGAY
jgi:hypothetical protein